MKTIYLCVLYWGTCIEDQGNEILHAFSNPDKANDFKERETNRINAEVVKYKQAEERFNAWEKENVPVHTYPDGSFGYMWDKSPVPYNDKWVEFMDSFLADDGDINEELNDCKDGFTIDVEPVDID